jgi:hypothetical protein
MKDFMYSFKKLPPWGTIICLSLFFVSACQDKCKTTFTYRVQTPQYKLIAEVRNAVGITTPQVLEQVGKIYYRAPYVFVNEVQKGIHIINNTNPKNPQKVAFINIPGNVDMAVKGNILYADNYIDLVAIDISNPNAVKITKRIENVFQNNFYYALDNKSILTEWKEELVTTAANDNCEPAPQWFRYDFRGAQGGLFSLNNSADVAKFVANNAGIGGSMARFTIYDNYLYAVSDQDLQVFDITSPTEPQTGNKINLGWGIETIFPYKDKLFIGSTSGMHIYNNSQPEKPAYMSRFEHARACDPVVVEGDYAYVTLRSGNACAGFVNQLDVINIQNLNEPTLVKSYPMQNPHGLGIDDGTLFLCEGEFGLKVFEAKDPLKINENQLQHFKGLHAFDVIPLGNVLLMIGEDGLYQYDYTNPKDLKLLSVMPIVKNL